MMDRTALDLSAFAVVIGTIAGWLPAIASLFSIVWLGLQIWDSRVVKELTGRGVKVPPPGPDP